MSLYLAPLAAWNTAFNPTVHGINEWEIFRGAINERREGFVITPSFSVERSNPGIAGIASSPSRYYVMSEKSADDEAAVELCRGRLTGLPTDMGKSTCTLEFLCLPPDDETVLKAAANLLRVGEVDYDPDATESEREAAEMYDPLFFDPDATDDPTTVLLARRQLFMWDRKTLQVRLIHMTDGEDEHIVNMALKEKLTFSVTNPPKNVSKLRIIIPFTQAAKGKQTFNRTGTFASYSYQDIQSLMPKSGDAIGNATGWVFDKFDFSSVRSSLAHSVSATSAEYGAAAGGTLTVRPHLIDYDYRAAFDFKQAREEIIDIIMPAAVQNILGDLKTEAVETLTVGQLNLDHTTAEWRYEDPETLDIQHYNVGDRVQINGKCFVCLTAHDAQSPFKYNDPENPETILWELTTRSAALTDLRTPRIADINRGKRIVRYGVRRLDRVVLERALAAEVSVEVPGTKRGYSCADTARIEHGKLVGGECVGPITGLEIRFDGAVRTTKITIACGIGNGSTPATAGVGQESTGGVVYTPSYGRVDTPVDAYSLAGLAPFVEAVYHDSDEQLSAANTAAFAGLDPMAALGSLPTQLHIGFMPLPEEDQLTRRVTITCEPIYVPKGIDITPTV